MSPPQVIMRAATVIADKCLETLKQLRGITATYRMTNKPLPTKASHFVPAILNPLHNIVDSAENKVELLARSHTLDFMTKRASITPRTVLLSTGG